MELGSQSTLKKLINSVLTTLAIEEKKQIVFQLLFYPERRARYKERRTTSTSRWKTYNLRAGLLGHGVRSYMGLLGLPRSHTAQQSRCVIGPSFRTTSCHWTCHRVDFQHHRHNIRWWRHRSKIWWIASSRRHLQTWHSGRLRQVAKWARCWP
jgi:hypothetical protein